MQATLGLAATVFLFGALGAGWLGASSVAGGGASAGTAIVDRTWSCPLHTSDGFRLLSIGGARGFVDIPTADAGMHVNDDLAPSARSQLLGASSRGLRVSRSCTGARRINLTRKGLPGPPDIFATSYDCESKPKSILIRLRAVLGEAGTWRHAPPAHLDLLKPVSSAQLVVQAPTGRRFAYATIAGKDFRLWVSPNCVRG